MIADKIYGFLFTDLNIQPYCALCVYIFITENYFFYRPTPSADCWKRKCGDGSLICIRGSGKPGSK